MPKFYTVMIELPEDTDQQREIYNVLKLCSNFMGGEIVAAAAYNVFAELEQLEEKLGQIDWDGSDN